MCNAQFIIDNSNSHHYNATKNGQKTHFKIGENLNMDSRWIAKQMIDFQKTTFDNMYTSMVMIQDHTEKLATTLFRQAIWIPEESSGVVNRWTEILKKGRNDFKVAVDDCFSKMEESLTADIQAHPEI